MSGWYSIKKGIMVWQRPAAPGILPSGFERRKVPESADEPEGENAFCDKRNPVFKVE